MIAAWKPREVQGLAMDHGAGVQRVEFSSDGGRSWRDAAPDRELGRYSWRRWRVTWKPPARGIYRSIVRATNTADVSKLQS